MHHLILIGDSILDNAACTAGGCNSPDDYANPIEPSVTGGAKIAQAIAQAVTEPAHAARGANVVS